MVDVVHVLVQRPPVQKPVRPVEPSVVKVVKGDDRGQHVDDLGAGASLDWCALVCKAREMTPFP